MKCFSPALYFLCTCCAGCYSDFSVAFDLFYLLCLSPLSSCGMSIGSSAFSLYRTRSVTYQLRLRLHYTDSLSCRHEKLFGIKSIPFYPAPNALNNIHNTKQMQTRSGFRNTKKHPKSQTTADNVFRPLR